MFLHWIWRHLHLLLRASHGPLQPPSKYVKRPNEAGGHKQRANIHLPQKNQNLKMRSHLPSNIKTKSRCANQLEQIPVCRSHALTDDAHHVMLQSNPVWRAGGRVQVSVIPVSAAGGGGVGVTGQGPPAGGLCYRLLPEL